MLRTVLLAAIVAFAPLSASAGPVFEIIGLGSLGYNASNFWGISATGAGRIDGRIVLRDGYVLPTSGGTSTIAPADIVSLTYSHTDPDPGDTNFVTPIFSFSASTSEILSVAGFIAETGGSHRIDPVSFDVLTSVGLSVFGNAGGGHVGTFHGNARLINTLIEIADTTQPDPIATIRMTQISTQRGRWDLTGFVSTSISEPTGALLVAAPLAWLMVRNRRTWR